MKIRNHLPELTAEEAERFWMTPVEVCDLGSVGDAADPKVKKLLNTLSDRGHVPCVKSGEARTAPRLYSLVSAAMLRTFYEITRDGRTYKYAQPVADAIRKTLTSCLEKCSNDWDFEQVIGDAILISCGIKDDGTPAKLTWSKDGESVEAKSQSYSANVFLAGALMTSVVRFYTDEFWVGDLLNRGVIERTPPRQIGLDGWPVDDGGDS